MKAYLDARGGEHVRQRVVHSLFDLSTDWAQLQVSRRHHHRVED